jgi:hypothetical protein
MGNPADEATRQRPGAVTHSAIAHAENATRGEWRFLALRANVGAAFCVNTVRTAPVTTSSVVRLPFTTGGYPGKGFLRLDV